MAADPKETRPDLPADGDPPSWRPPPRTPRPSTEGEPTVPARPVLDQTTSRPSAPPPRRIGRYMINRTLGRGGMGVVYLAHDEKLDREVALKVIPIGPDSDPVDLARFRSEAEVAARLQHPHIVPVYEVGETDEVAYMAMEYVPGGTLHRRLTQEPFTPREASRLVEQVARGVQYAHENGVIHRDLKPSNILLLQQSATSGTTTPNEASGPFPKIADFGLAKRVDRPLHLTRSGVALGTPNYMAPEQARGSSNEIGPAADVHALGAMLYELIVGYPPFGGGTPMETMHQVVHKKPVPPSKLRDGVPPELESICMRCLEKDPRKRFASAAELADRLHSFLSGMTPTRPTRIAFPGELSDPEPAPKRNWFSPIAIGVVFAVGAAGLAVWLTDRTYQKRLASERAERLAISRTAVEAPIAWCEEGRIAEGIDRWQRLGEVGPGLPVRELIDAWSDRLLLRPQSQPGFRAAVAAFSPRGDQVVTADGSTIDIWTTDSWERIGKSISTDAPVTALGWSDDGKFILVGTSKGQILRGDGTTPLFGLTPTVTGATSPILAVAPAATEVRFVTAATAAVRSTKAGEAGGPDGNLGPIVAAHLHGLTNSRVVIGEGKTVHLFDWKQNRWFDLPPEGYPTAVAISPDRNVVAVGTLGGQVRLWDAHTRTPLTDTVRIGPKITAISIRQEGTDYVVLACPEQKPAMQFRSRSPFVGPVFRAGSEVRGVTLGSDGRTVFVTTVDGAHRWTVPAGDLSDLRFPPAAGQRLVAGAAHAKGLALGSKDGSIRMVDPEDRTVREDHLGREEEFNSITAQTEGRGVVAVGRRGKGGFARHWRPDDSAKASLFQCESTIFSAAYLADGSAIALGCEDGVVRIWAPGEDQPQAELNTNSPVLSVATAPGLILAGCADGSAYLWNFETKDAPAIFRHRVGISAVAFWRERPMTASLDGTVRVWDVGSALPVGMPLRHASGLIAIDVRGDLCVTADQSGLIRTWRLRP